MNELLYFAVITLHEHIATTVALTVGFVLVMLFVLQAYQFVKRILD